ncbi:hypothetical protein BJ138DRAFT_1228837 [Hygrophoropsis aurantiaca]|uniref:Uncharacterized protein n=1 Tax=Hygrophoropsis aurantiaca TaxID=72124 RepID=A0ACB7ZXV9_9AGAM|nr:hypothetical protein BJ138DRAFT_1228837 [Hygrophoropsis aurantiaca]
MYQSSQPNTNPRWPLENQSEAPTSNAMCQPSNVYFPWPPKNQDPPATSTMPVSQPYSPWLLESNVGAPTLTGEIQPSELNAEPSWSLKNQFKTPSSNVLSQDQQFIDDCNLWISNHYELSNSNIQSELCAPNVMPNFFPPYDQQAELPVEKRLDDAILKCSVPPGARSINSSTKAFYHPTRLEIIEEAEEHMQLFLVTRNAFPNSDDAYSEIEEIFYWLHYAREHQLEDWTWLTDDRGPYHIIFEVPKHFRASVKTKASNLLRDYFGDPSAYPPELSQLAETGQLTCQRDDQLYFWPPVVQLILQMWFGDKGCLGHRFPFMFSHDGTTLSNEPLALAITAFQIAALAKSKEPTGERVPFMTHNRDGTDAWGEIYTLNLAALNNIMTETYGYRAAIYRIGCSYYILKGHAVSISRNSSKQHIM